MQRVLTGPVARPSRLRRFGATFVGVAMLLVGSGSGRAEAHITSVTGSATGHGCTVTVLNQFSCGLAGPPPSVTLAADASNSPQAAMAVSATATAGPATIFSSGQIDVSAAGVIGAGGSVQGSTIIQNVNASGTEPFTAAVLASTCSGDDDGVHASTTITNGTLRTDSGDSDPTNSIPDHAPVNVTLPASPPPNTMYTGHVHNANTTNTFTYVFNEQGVDAGGSITVVAAHENLMGPTAVGDLLVGQSVCGTGRVPDTSAPETTIDAGPPETIATDAVTFAFSASEAGATFDCKLDGPGAATAGYSPCSSPTSYAGLATGIYTFSVRATDAVGNVDASAATRTFTVTTVAPPNLMASIMQPPDRVAPAARLVYAKVQRLGPSVRLRVACPVEACRARVRGSVRVPRVRSRATKRYELTPASAPIAQGGQATLAPRLSRTARTAIARALRGARRIVVKLTITAVDAAGNTTTLAGAVRLKR